MTTDCLICRHTADSFAHAKIMGRYDVEYFRCRDCQFIQTETPYWLDEAYSTAIVSTDVGLVHRNERFARITDRLLRLVYPDASRCLDYGGGYGMFTRMMRDRGHHYFHRDPYCENLFAVGFEANDDAGPDESGRQFDLLSAFEVLEHLADPHRDLQQFDLMAENWLVSTEVVPHPAPKPGQWWYYVLDGGQHISLWSRRALQSVAAYYNRHLISYRGLHVFSRSNRQVFLTKQVLRDRSVRVLDRLRRRRSLLGDDFRHAVKCAGQAA